MCKECSKKLRLIIYQYLDSDLLYEKLNEIPKLFSCVKEIKIYNRDKYILEVECQGTISYIIMTDRKKIISVIPLESSLQSSHKTSWDRKNKVYS